MKSKIFSVHELKDASRGQLWIPLFILAACFVAFPVILLLNIERADMFVSEYHVSAANAYSYIWRYHVFLAGAAVAGGSGILCGASGFWYLYSKRKVDHYHSLPRKRSEMFWEKVFLGAGFYLIPCVITVFLALCVGGARGYFYLGILGVAAATVLMCLLVYLVFYFSVVLVISFTGNILMGVLSAGGVFLYMPVLASVITFCQYMFFENAGEYPYGILQNMRQYGSPLLMTLRLTEEWRQQMPLKTVPLLLLTGIAMAAAAFAAYVCRPSEKTGSSLVYRFTGPIIRIMIVIPVSLAIGWVFGGSSSNSSSFWWIFGLVFGAVTAHGILGILFSLDARGFFYGWREFVCEALMIALCAAVFQGDLLGYDQYIPRQEELVSVGIRRGIYGTGYFGLDYVSADSEGRYLLAYDNYYENVPYNYYCATPEVYRALENMVNNGGSKDREDGGAYSAYSVCYKTKSGELIYRTYYADEEQVAALNSALAVDEKAVFQRTKFLEIDEEYLETITGEFADGERAELFTKDAAKREELFEALRMDYEDADPEDFLEIPCASLELWFTDLPLAETTEGLPVEGKELTGNYTNILYVYPGFERTVALLQETGYPLSVEEISFYSAEILGTIWDDEAGEYTTQTVVLEEPGELEELKACLVSSALSTGCQVINQEFTAIVQPEEGDEIYFLLLEDKIPESIREAIESVGENETGE